MAAECVKEDDRLHPVRVFGFRASSDFLKLFFSIIGIALSASLQGYFRSRWSEPVNLVSPVNLKN